VAKRVVVGLEVIQIEQQQTQGAAIPARLRDSLVERPIMAASIGQTAKGIVLGHPAQ